MTQQQAEQLLAEIRATNNLLELLLNDLRDLKMIVADQRHS